MMTQARRLWDRLALTLSIHLPGNDQVDSLFSASQEQHGALLLSHIDSPIEGR